MTLTVNGEETEISGPLTLAGLIKHLQLVPERVAVERNREIVPRGRWAEKSMEEGDGWKSFILWEGVACRSFRVGMLILPCGGTRKRFFLRRQCSILCG